MEREVGGGIGMGNTCKPMAVSFQCMTKSTTILKKKKIPWTEEPGGLQSEGSQSWTQLSNQAQREVTCPQSRWPGTEPGFKPRCLTSELCSLPLHMVSFEMNSVISNGK